MTKLPFGLSNKDSLARKLVEATLGGAGVRIAGMGLTFLVGVQLARQLGPEGYGVYGTVMALVAMLLVPAQLGLTNLVTRDISISTTSDAFGESKGALVWFAVCTLAASLVISIIGVAFIVLQGEGSIGARTYIWGFISVPLLALSNFGVASLRGFQHVLTAQVYDALVRPALFAALLFMASLSGTLDAALAMAMQAVAGALALGVTAYKLASLLSPEIIKAKAVAHWRNWIFTALSMAGTEIVRAFDGQYAVLLFGVLTTLGEVGVFRVALAVAGFVGLPATLINLVVAPYVAELHAKEDGKRLQLVATGAVFATFGATALATLVFAAFGGAALALVFGEAYRAAWAPLTLLSLGYTVNGFFGSAPTILNMTGHERTVAQSYAFGVAVGVVVNLALFPLLGVSSAGVALIISEIVKGVLMNRVARRRLAIDTSIIALFTNLPSLVQQPLVAARRVKRAP